MSKKLEKKKIENKTQTKESIKTTTLKLNKEEEEFCFCLKHKLKKFAKDRYICLNCWTVKLNKNDTIVEGPPLINVNNMVGD